MSLDDLRTRPLTEADAPAVLELTHGYDREFYGEPMIDLEDLLSHWRAPSFALADTVGVLGDHDQLIAVGEVDGRGRIELATTPAERELGSDLSAHFEGLARERGRDCVRQFVAATDVTGRARLEARGYAVDYVSWILRLDPGTEIRGRQLPAGYQVRPFLPDDAEEVYALIHEAFGEWQTEQLSYADWRAQMLERPGVDPSTFRVASWTEDGSEPKLVGVCLVFDGEQEAWVPELATHRDHRGRGVAQQLLAEVFAAARTRGLDQGGLSTDTRTGALELYQRLGMQVFCTMESWQLRL